ncbi:MAG: hypothetical protein JNK05_16455 [Myxococcales bacterium]|nr:hypothetical protein [Myxococcales bacterium]
MKRARAQELRRRAAIATLVGASGCTFFPAPVFTERDARASDATMDGDAAFDVGPPRDVVLDGPCLLGTLDCDRDPSNGCETRESIANCGRCERVCAIPSGTPACVDGACAVGSCVAGFGDCDRNPDNGCEERLDSNAHCGACGRRCEGATPNCVGGMCVSGCASGQLRCDGLCVDVQSNDAHCGACGRRCGAVANGRTQCSNGMCDLRCSPGFGNCDNNIATGCEASLETNANCGRCMAPCGAGSTCNATLRSCQASCTGTDCGGACIDTTSSISHCGACGNVCPTLANAVPGCTAGRCQSNCAAGYGDCDANPANGCEAQLSSNAAHCGACGRPCSFPNATASCVGGACVLGTCNSGFANCDGNPANGCETNTQTSADNCGGCGRVCALANAMAACSAGACVLGPCVPNFGNCDGIPANGCEQSLRTLFHCGECGQFCGDLPCGTEGRCDLSAEPPQCRCR